MFNTIFLRLFKATINILCKSSCKHMLSLLLDKYLGVEWLDHRMGRCTANFTNKTKTKQLSAFRGMVSLHSYPSCRRVLAPLPALLLLLLSVLPILPVLMEFSMVVSNLLFLMSLDVEHPFKCVWIIICLLWRTDSFKSLPIYLSGR